MLKTEKRVGRKPETRLPLCVSARQHRADAAYRMYSKKALLRFDREGADQIDAATALGEDAPDMTGSSARPRAGSAKRPDDA